MSKFNFVDWLRIDCGFVIMDLQDFIIVDLTGFFDIVGQTDLPCGLVKEHCSYFFSK